MGRMADGIRMNRRVIDLAMATGYGKSAQPTGFVLGTKNGDDPLGHSRRRPATSDLYLSALNSGMRDGTIRRSGKWQNLLSMMRTALEDKRSRLASMETEPSPPPPIAPSRLPGLRRRMCNGAPDDHQRLLSAADLYWVSAEMTGLVIAAAESLPEPDLGRSLWPSDVGFMVFAEPLPLPLTSLAEPPSLSAILWAPGSDGVRVICWSSYEETVKFFAAQMRAQEVEAGKVAFGANPGMAAYRALAASAIRENLNATELPVYLDGDLPNDEGKVDQRITAYLSTAWLLLGQPLLVESTTELHHGGKVSGKRKPAPVTIVDLRRVRHTDTPSGHSGRSYDHRWVVRGHWRNQAWGKGRAERRPVWIAPYVKGPDDAPFVVTEKVNVWRR